MESIEVWSEEGRANRLVIVALVGEDGLDDEDCLRCGRLVCLVYVTCGLVPCLCSYIYSIYVPRYIPTYLGTYISSLCPSEDHRPDSVKASDTQMPNTGHDHWPQYQGSPIESGLVSRLTMGIASFL